MYASEDDIFAYPVQVDNDEEDDYGLPSDDDSSKITGTRKEPPSQPRSKTNPFLQENIHVLKGGKEDVHRSVPTSSTHTIQQNATEYALQRLEGRTASTAFYHDQESSKSPMARRSSKVTNREASNSSHGRQVLQKRDQSDMLVLALHGIACIAQQLYRLKHVIT